MFRHRKRILAGGAVIAAVLLALGLHSAIGVRSARVERNNLMVASVERGVLHDFIPVRARVVPHDTIYVDASDGGRVEHVLVNPGDQVKAGQPLLDLSNTQLELQVLEQEGRLVESITQLQSYQIQLEQYRLNNESALIDIDANIIRLERSLARRATLSGMGAEPIETKEQVEDDLKMYRKKRPLQAESNKTQDDLRLQQLPRIKIQLETLNQDLAITRSKLDALKVRAPSDGQVTAMDLKVGQTVKVGERLGEITPDTGVKLTQEVDEFYLLRLRIGQVASVLVGGKDVQASVSRIYPQVKNGTFSIDLSFPDGGPPGLLPGQTIYGKLALGEDAPGVVMAPGPFLETTGGDWVFVIGADGRTAVRRRIKIGRRNAEQLQILSGLEPGDKVVVSDYSGFDHIERLDIHS